MFRKRITVLTLITVVVSGLLACQTTDLIGGLAQNNSASPPTRAQQDSGGTTTVPRTTRDPNSEYLFVPASTPRCTVGDNAASVVTGTIVENEDLVAGQRVQASSGEGGEPITEEPALSDDNGTFQVTFVCDGKACDGSFWIWIVDDADAQISPFIKFVFDNQCRRGTVNFRNP